MAAANDARDLAVLAALSHGAHASETELTVGRVLDPAAPGWSENRVAQRLRTCEYAGGGTYGHVVTDRARHLAFKMIDVVSGTEHEAQREVANGVIARHFSVDFLCAVIDWFIWREPPAGGASRARHDIDELLGASARAEFQTRWLEQYRTNTRTARGAHIDYAQARAEFFAPPHTVVVVQQTFAGDTTVAALVQQMASAGASGSQVWTRLRPLILVLAHVLYWLQGRFNFVHGDLHPGNVTLMNISETRLPAVLEGIRVRVVGLPSQVTRSLSLASDLGGRVPIIIDLGKATFGSEVAIEVLGAGVGATMSAHRPSGRSRTTDFRRFAMYLMMDITYAVHRYLHGCVRENRAPEQAVLRTRISLPMLRTVVSLLAVPRAWVNHAASAASAGGTRGSLVRSPRAWISMMSAVYLYAHKLTAYLDPERRPAVTAEDKRFVESYGVATFVDVTLRRFLYYDINAMTAYFTTASEALASADNDSARKLSLVLQWDSMAL